MRCILAKVSHAESMCDLDEIKYVYYSGYAKLTDAKKYFNPSSVDVYAIEYR